MLVQLKRFEKPNFTTDKNVTQCSKTLSDVLALLLWWFVVRSQGVHLLELDH
jgi:hypothetical protein